ncbi:MAG: hypothetical protein WC496_02880 [Phycisphaerae bacterium]|jgi:hypothetical protein
MSKPTERYISLIERRIKTIRKDLPSLIELGERMAENLIAGGNIFAPPVIEYWSDEYDLRAGNFMGLESRNYVSNSEKDVAFFPVLGYRERNVSENKTLNTLIKSKANLFVLGRKEDTQSLNSSGRFAGFTGGCDPNEGLYETETLCPFAPTLQFEQIVRGWVTTGEMICACIRQGKMPTIWLSVWLEGGWVRNNHFIKQDNLHGPWLPPMFHDNWYTPPLPAGYAGGEFLDAIEKSIKTIKNQADIFGRIGQWLAEAKNKGHRAGAAICGHCYPRILELSEEFNYPLEIWPPFNADLNRAAPVEELGKGDVAIYMGYGRVDTDAVWKILDRGVRLIHTSPYGRLTNLQNHENMLWFDLPWRPGDAIVDIPGYSARILPMSSSVQTAAYFAILSEMAECLGVRQRNSA